MIVWEDQLWTTKANGQIGLAVCVSQMAPMRRMHCVSRSLQISPRFRSADPTQHVSKVATSYQQHRHSGCSQPFTAANHSPERAATERASLWPTSHVECSFPFPRSAQGTMAKPKAEEQQQRISAPQSGDHLETQLQSVSPPNCKSEKVERFVQKLKSSENNQREHRNAEYFGLIKLNPDKFTSEHLWCKPVHLTNDQRPTMAECEMCMKRMELEYPLPVKKL